MDYCSICGAEITNEDAAILTMGAAGIPRYICEECEKDLDTAISGKDVEEITTAIKSLSEKMVNGNPDTPDDVDTAKDMDGAAKVLKRQFADVRREQDYIRIFDADDTESIVAYLIMNGHTVSEIKKNKIGLEEYYIELMSAKEGK